MEFLLTTAIVWAVLSILALIVYFSVRAVVRIVSKGWRPPYERRLLLVFSLAVLFPAAAYLEMFGPVTGIYSNPAASYWISRAAGESDHDGKRRHVARIALSSEYGSHIAKSAIGKLEDGRERCLLRTILAGLPEVRNQEDRRREAELDCSAGKKS